MCVISVGWQPFRGFTEDVVKLLEKFTSCRMRYVSIDILFLKYNEEAFRASFVNRLLELHSREKGRR
jgi:hypothetical protein